MLWCSKQQAMKLRHSNFCLAFDDVWSSSVGGNNLSRYSKPFTIELQPVSGHRPQYPISCPVLFSTHNQGETTEQCQARRVSGILGTTTCYHWLVVCSAIFLRCHVAIYPRRSTPTGASPTPRSPTWCRTILHWLVSWYSWYRGTPSIMNHAEKTIHISRPCCLEFL